MTLLSLSNCDNVSQIEWPTPSTEVSLNSKAVEIATDFRINRPLIIDYNTKAVEAEYLMKKAHVKLKLVTDYHDNFLGTVSFNDLNNQEIIKKVAFGDSRTDLYVSDFMKHRSDLTCIDWQSIESVSIRLLIHTFMRSNEQHILITENGGTTIRGLVSASDIARALHLNISLAKAVSFKLINKAINFNNQSAA